MEVPEEETDDAINNGLTIGTYRHCSLISDGVTSEVYRSGSTALKVIVAHVIEPHNPQREARILQSLHQHPSIIELLDVFRDQEHRLVLAFPYMPLSLADALDKRRTALPVAQIRSIFTDVVRGLAELHTHGIIHRDVKPSAVLLSSATGPAVLSDFGTAWHPDFSAASEPSDAKVLDIGTGPYRAPDVLFGDCAYGPSVDMWALGVMLSEAITTPPRPIFESRPAHEDGSQLGLILSIFKTLGTPTPQTWPEAAGFKVSPFELWTRFPERSWDEIMPGVDPVFRDLVSALIRYDRKRATADQV
jgi:serine/threonine protein kinase